MLVVPVDSFDWWRCIGKLQSNSESIVGATSAVWIDMLSVSSPFGIGQGQRFKIHVLVGLERERKRDKVIPRPKRVSITHTVALCFQFHDYHSCTNTLCNDYLESFKKNITKK